MRSRIACQRMAGSESNNQSTIVISVLSSSRRYHKAAVSGMGSGQSVERGILSDRRFDRGGSATCARAAVPLSSSCGSNQTTFLRATLSLRSPLRKTRTGRSASDTPQSARSGFTSKKDMRAGWTASQLPA